MVECAVWGGEVEGSNPSLETNLILYKATWLSHHTFNVALVGSNPTYSTNFDIRIYSAKQPKLLKLGFSEQKMILVRFNSSELVKWYHTRLIILCSQFESDTRLQNMHH